MLTGPLRMVPGAVAVAAVMIALLPGSASAARDDSRPVPVESRVARVTDNQAPATRISKAAYLRGAKRAGATVTAADRAAVIAATSCWRWDAWRLGENIWGADLWKSHHRVNWCGDGSWIRVHAYTERWGETPGIGWVYNGVTQSGQRYGVNWNQYQSWSQFRFCYVPYVGCVQEANPYHNTTVFPNGSGRWN